MLLPTLRNAPVANSANAESISVSVISATRCERRFRTFFFLKKVNIRKRFRNPAHRSKFKLYRPLGYIIIPKILTHIQQSNQIRMHFPAGIIPARAFSQIRINFPAGNHPCGTFSAIQDAMTFSRCPRRFQPFRPREENPSSFSAERYPPGDFPALQTSAARQQACIPTPDNPSRPDLSV